MQKVTTNSIIISSVIQKNSGGGLINQRNIDLLEQLFQNVSIYYLRQDNPKAKSSPLTKISERLQGVFCGLTFKYLADIKQILKQQQPDILFINQSLFGIVAKECKKVSPNTKIITFFHNVELLYFRSQLSIRPTNIIDRLNCMAARKAEKLAVNLSDYLICMNLRDSNSLKKLYGREANLLLPTSFDDRGAVDYCPSKATEPLELLFVGFNFFANLHGLEWFCREVMPKVKNVNLTVVGRDMERERARLESSNITIVGSVDDLKHYYAQADMVVSPIFIGSGMKTKTAEALMYGLPLLATGEALEGYDIEAQKVGARCDTADEFVERLNYFAAHKGELAMLSENGRNYFEMLYSQEIITGKFEQFFSEI